jgi:hypothetical protein
VDDRAPLRPDHSQPPHRPFERRGLPAARSEWRLIAATHNLLKLHRHSLKAAGACNPRLDPILRHEAGGAVIQPSLRDILTWMWQWRG